LAEREEEILTTGEAGHSAVCRVRRYVAPSLRVTCAPCTHPGKHLRFTRAACLEFASRLGRVDLIGPVLPRGADLGQPTPGGKPSGSDVPERRGAFAAPDASALSLSGQQPPTDPTEEREQITAEEIAEVHRAEVDEVVAGWCRATRR